MFDGKSSAEKEDGACCAYSYPRDVAQFIRDRWNDAPQTSVGGATLPDTTTLENFCSACYQAGLLREEERPVTFRAILAAPVLFPADGMPPESMQRMKFSRALSFDATELRRLSVAADTQRTLIGVEQDEEGGLRIWGLINSGIGWLRDVQGGRRAGAPLPPALVIHVDAPGSMTAYKGHSLLATLQSGRLSGSRADPFVSKWLPEQFTLYLEELTARHKHVADDARERGEQWAQLEPTLPRKISERMMKRVIALLRDAHHGGTIIFVPMQQAGDLCTEDPYIDLKYRLADDRARRSFPDLVVKMLSRLAKIYGGSERRHHKLVGWCEFEMSTDHELATLDEALFETAHLIAALASADGAVVMNKEHDLLGFGGMISGRLPEVRTVVKALDLEADRIAEESTENVGARHRSAYRLAAALPGTVVIVISQDGGVRFVAQNAGRATYWEQE